MDTPERQSAESALVATPLTVDFDESPVETSQVQPNITPEEPEVTPAEPGEGEGQGEAPEAEEPEEPALSYHDLLPGRQAREYPDELYSLAVQAYGGQPQDLESQVVRSILKSKIDSDIYIANQRRQAEMQELAAPEPETEPEPAETEPSPESAAPVPTLTFPQMVETAKQVADSMATPEGSDYVGDRMYSAFSAKTAALDMAEDDPKRSEAVKSANREITKSLMEMGLLFFADLMPRVFPDMMRQQAQQFIPEMIKSQTENLFTQREESTDQEMELYDQARYLVAQQPEFRELQNMTPKQLQSLEEEFWKETGNELVDMQFRNPETGKPLGATQNAVAQYRHLLRWGRGSQPPADQWVRQGFERGRRDAEQRQRRSDLGRLGSGRPSGMPTPADSVDEEMAALKNAFDAANPMSLEAVSNRNG